ncbi:MAG TPA: HNH endonuclease [Dehalococcoidia bacterium]|nr:HNH endonuclease [Dehalococcoidia bacterium]
MRWFRLYGDMPDDPKVGTLTDAEFRTWVEMLCLACREDNGGCTSATPDNISWLLRRNVMDTIPALLARKLIHQDKAGHYVITKWEARQATSDSSRERVARYRDRLKSKGKTNDYLKHRSAVYERDHHACVYCASQANLCLDHLVPLIRGGDNEPDNLVTACKQCNSGKAGRTVEEAGYRFKNLQAEQRYVTVKARLCNGYGNGPEKRREEKKRVVERAKALSYTPEFQELWSMYPRRDGSKADAFKAYQRTLREGVTHARLIEGVRAYADYVRRNGVGQRYVAHASTWINQGRWEADYRDERPYLDGKPDAPPSQPSRSRWDIEAERISAKRFGTANANGGESATGGYREALRAPETVRQDDSGIRNTP